VVTKNYHIRAVYLDPTIDPPHRGTIFNISHVRVALTDLRFEISAALFFSEEHGDPNGDMG
jgi:hypothetical protein